PVTNPSTRIGAPVSFNNTDFLKAFSQSFLSFVISQNPNNKLDASNITPPWRLYNQGQTEMMFNKTADNLPDVRPVTTGRELLERCRQVILGKCSGSYRTVIAGVMLINVSINR
ncbi:cephalosporin esterase, partial [Moniliophthora roreri]